MMVSPKPYKASLEFVSEFGSGFGVRVWGHCPEFGSEFAARIWVKVQSLESRVWV